ncbi:MAG TPA: SRPBCC family protein [Anaerolineales bacterium]|nr:SRPBCC family protein [Anaerolineales bacterium]
MAGTVTKSVIVKGRIDDVYEVWSDFKNFPRFMEHIQSVTADDGQSHWVMQGPLGTTIEWDAETTRMDHNQRIAWSSKDGSPVKTSGQVTFKELPDQEVEVTATVHYEPGAGLAGDLAASLFGDVEGRLDQDLRNFKAHVEGMHDEPSNR